MSRSGSLFLYMLSLEARLCVRSPAFSQLRKANNTPDLFFFFRLWVKIKVCIGIIYDPPKVGSLE